tara:strand:- start:3719 stop:4048 length:330 start_codon:yes stop_codon:yes gene_type:complete
MMLYTIEIIAAIDMLIVILFAVFLRIAKITKNQNETLQRELEDFKKDHLRSFATVLDKTSKQHLIIKEFEKQIELKNKEVIFQTNARINQLESKIYKDFDMYRQQGRQY